MNKNLLPLCLGGLSIGTAEFVMMGLLPFVAAGFEVTIPQAGYGIACYALGVVIGAPLLTMMGSGLAPRKHLIVLLLLFAAFNTLSAFAPNNTVLCLTRLLSGLPHGAFFGVGSVVATRLAKEGKQAQAIATMFAGLTLANLVTVPLGTYIGLHYSWRYVFIMTGLMSFASAFALRRFLPNVAIDRPTSMRNQFGLFKLVEPWLVILITTIGTGGLFCWISYISPLMTRVSGFSASAMPSIMVWIGLGMLFGNQIGGRLSDRKTPIAACLILLLAMALTLTGIYFFSGIKIVSLALAFIAGCCAMAIGSPIQTLMIHSSKGYEFLGASLTQAAFNTGNALGAYLGGLPIAAGLGYTSPQLVGISMALIGAGFAYILMEYLRRQDAEIVPENTCPCPPSAS